MTTSPSHASHCPDCFQPAPPDPACDHCGFDGEAVVDGASYLAAFSLLHQQRYRVGRILGRPGAYGVVYAGWDERLAREVAIKEFFPQGSLAERDRDHLTVCPRPGQQQLFVRWRERFLGEAQLLAGFEGCRGIVQVRDVFEANSTAYLVMERLRGETLAQRLQLDTQLGRAASTLRLEDGALLLATLLDTLELLHRRGVVHRDISPNNLFLRNAELGGLALLDFGLAGDVGPRAVGATSAGLGTPGFAAPEQLLAGNAASGTMVAPSVDLYALGAVFYLAWGGRMPLAVEERRSGVPQTSLHRLRPDLPDAIADVIDACLQLDPAQRPPDVAAIRARLSALTLLPQPRVSMEPAEEIAAEPATEPPAESTAKPVAEPIAEPAAGAGREPVAANTEPPARPHTKPLFDEMLAAQPNSTAQPALAGFTSQGPGAASAAPSESVDAAGSSTGAGAGLLSADPELHAGSPTQLHRRDRRTMGGWWWVVAVLLAVMLWHWWPALDGVVRRLSQSEHTVAATQTAAQRQAPAPQTPVDARLPSEALPAGPSEYPLIVGAPSAGAAGEVGTPARSLPDPVAGAESERGPAAAPKPKPAPEAELARVPGADGAAPVSGSSGTAGGDSRPALSEPVASAEVGGDSVASAEHRPLVPPRYGVRRSPTEVPPPSVTPDPPARSSAPGVVSALTEPAPSKRPWIDPDERSGSGSGSDTGRVPSHPPGSASPRSAPVVVITAPARPTTRVLPSARGVLAPPPGPVPLHRVPVPSRPTSVVAVKPPSTPAVVSVPAPGEAPPPTVVVSDPAVQLRAALRHDAAALAALPAAQRVALLGRRLQTHLWNGELLEPPGSNALIDFLLLRGEVPRDPQLHEAFWMLADHIEDRAYRHLDEERVDAATALLGHGRLLARDMWRWRDLDLAVREVRAERHSGRPAGYTAEPPVGPSRWPVDRGPRWDEDSAGHLPWIDDGCFDDPRCAEFVDRLYDSE